MKGRRAPPVRRWRHVQPRVTRRFKGSDLLGVHYTPPFPFFAGRHNAHQVLPADYVTTDDGTGIVHIAPAFGEDDYGVFRAELAAKHWPASLPKKEPN